MHEINTAQTIISHTRFTKNNLTHTRERDEKEKKCGSTEKYFAFCQLHINGVIFFTVVSRSRVPNRAAECLVQIDCVSLNISFPHSLALLCLFRSHSLSFFSHSLIWFAALLCLSVTYSILTMFSYFDCILLVEFDYFVWVCFHRGRVDCAHFYARNFFPE